MNTYFVVPSRMWLCCRKTIALIALSLIWSSLTHASTEHDIGDVRESELFNLLLTDSESGQRIDAKLNISTDIDMTVTGPIVRARVRQTFTNPSQHWVEGIYTYPLPANASVDRMRLKIGDRIIESRIQENQQAIKTYQQAKKSGRKTALLEKPKGNLFTTNVANIAPNDSVVIEFTYQEFLSFSNNGYSLRVPLVATPRYTPKSSASVQTESNNRNLHARASAKSDKTPLHFKGVFDRPGNPVSINLKLDAGFEIAHLNSPSHPVKVKAKGGSNYEVLLPSSVVHSNRDFILDWSYEPSKTPKANVFYEQFEGENFGLLTLLPPSVEGAIEARPRELILVLDVSGSMSGPSIRQAKQAVRSTIEKLSPDDSFNLIFFNNRSWSLFPEPRPADASHRAFALAGLSQIDADGGTEMSQALAMATSFPERSEVLTQVVLITDGAVSNEQQLLQQVLGSLGQRRLFTVGIGSAPNGYFMRRAAEAGRGRHTFISQISRVDAAIDELLESLRKPALTDISLHSDKAIELVLAELPDLYANDPKYVAFKSTAQPTNFSVQGQFNGQSYLQPISLNPRKTEGVHIEWARRGIEKLTQQLSSQAARQNTSLASEIRKRIVDLGIRHQQVSKFTSLVAVDQTPVRAGGSLVSERMRSNLPLGWQSSKAVPVNLAQTSTNAVLMTQAGLIWLFVALVLLMLMCIRGKELRPNARSIAPHE